MYVRDEDLGIFEQLSSGITFMSLQIPCCYPFKHPVYNCQGSPFEKSKHVKNLRSQAATMMYRYAHFLHLFKIILAKIANNSAFDWSLN